MNFPTTSDVIYQHTFHFYNEYGTELSHEAGNLNLTLGGEELRSVCFDKANSNLHTYVEYVDKALEFCSQAEEICEKNKKQNKNLVDREVAQMDHDTDPQASIQILIQDLEGLVNTLHGFLLKDDAKNALNFTNLKLNGLEKAKDNNSLTLKEIRETIDMCINKHGKGIVVDSIKKESNIFKLEILLKAKEEQEKTYKEEIDELKKSETKCYTLMPRDFIDHIKGIQDEVAGTIDVITNRISDIAKSEQIPDANLQELNEIAEITLTFFQVNTNTNFDDTSPEMPSLAKAEEMGKVASTSVPLKDYSLLSEECSIKLAEEIFEEAGKLDEVKELKQYSFEGAKYDQTHDPEFQYNPWVYAYLKCLMDKNNAENKEILKKICYKIYNKKIGLDTSSNEHHVENSVQPFSDEHTEHDVQSLPDDDDSFDVDDGSTYIPENDAINETSDVGTSPDFMGSNLRKSDNSQGATLRRQVMVSDDNDDTPTSNTRDAVEPQSDIITSNEAQNAADSSNLNLDSVQDAVKCLNDEYAESTKKPFVDKNNKPLTLEEINAKLEEQYTEAICKLGSPEQVVLITYLVQFFAKYYDKKSHTSAIFVKTLRNSLKKQSEALNKLLERQSEALTPAIEFLIKVAQNCEYSFLAKIIEATLPDGKIFELTKNGNHEIKVKIYQNGETKKDFNIPTQQNLDALFRDVSDNLNKKEGEKNNQNENEEKET